MSKRNRLSRDQKRKQKLAERPARERPGAAGHDRYRSPKFVNVTFETEVGIYEGYVISRREITDYEVELALRQLIVELRTTPAAELISANCGEAAADREPVDICVLYRWRDLLDEGKLPQRDDLIGVLGSILRSVDTWRSRSASSRAYLNYLEGFLQQLGVSVQEIDSAGNPVKDERVDELYEVGRMWLAGSDEARRRFLAQADEILKTGDPDQVVDAAQRLLPLVTPQKPEFAVLSELSIRAQKVPRSDQHGFASGIKSFVARLGGR